MLKKNDTTKNNTASKSNSSTSAKNRSASTKTEAPSKTVKARPATENKTASNTTCTSCSTKANSTPSQLHTLNTKTRITVKYDVGYSNTLYIRGSGANLSWHQGAPLKNIKSDEWVWETEEPLSSFEFKVLINDHLYETGENHRLQTGSYFRYTPYFHS